MTGFETPHLAWRIRGASFSLVSTDRSVSVVATVEIMGSLIDVMQRPVFPPDRPVLK